MVWNALGDVDNCCRGAVEEAVHRRTGYQGDYFDMMYSSNALGY